MSGTHENADQGQEYLREILDLVPGDTVFLEKMSFDGKTLVRYHGTLDKPICVGAIVLLDPEFTLKSLRTSPIVEIARVSEGQYVLRTQNSTYRVRAAESRIVSSAESPSQRVSPQSQDNVVPTKRGQFATLFRRLFKRS
jgi:hypothetical protein